MFYLIDNYDSFVYNLAADLEHMGHEVLVVRSDDVTTEQIRALNPNGLILSPGPKRPQDAAVCHKVLAEFQGLIPILGVCLGHQVIGQAFGGCVEKGQRPMHGKLSFLTHDGTGLFQGLPPRFQVTRYHSLVVTENNLPPQLQVTARSEDDVIMALKHAALPIYGVQFHPEAVLTDYGTQLLANFCQICLQEKPDHAAH